MDPVSLLLPAAMFVASTFGRKVADDVAKGVWEEIKVRLSVLLRREPEPADLIKPEAKEVIENDRELATILDKYLNGTTVLRRAGLVGRALKGARMLWIDNNPAGNALERECLTALGVLVTTVETTQSALACLDHEKEFHLAVSDIARGVSSTESTAGLDALPKLKRLAPAMPVIFYVTNLEPRGVPPGAFGITNRPDELLHLCMDAVERMRL